MGWEEQYESWKKQRAKVEVPIDFTDRVMASVHQARQRMWWFVLQRLATVAWRSKIVRTSICSLALIVYLVRVGSLLAIFIPPTIGN